MAQGITQRTSAGLGGNYADANDLARDVKRWGDRLPFGSFGFQATNTTTRSLPAATATVLTFDTMYQDREGWVLSQVNPFSAFIVPEGGSGVYQLTLATRLTASHGTTTDIVMDPAINATAFPSAFVVATAVLLTSINYTLAVGDVVDLDGVFQVQNITPASTSDVGSYFQVTDPTATTSIVPGNGSNLAGIGGALSRQQPSDSRICASIGRFTCAVAGTHTFQYVLYTTAGSTGAANSTSAAMRITRLGGQQLTRQFFATIQVNNVAVASADITDTPFGVASTLAWLSDGDVISATLFNNSAGTAATLAADFPTASIPSSPLLSATRISLL